MKDSIRISPEKFRAIVQSKITLSGLAETLEVSKQTVNSWLSSASLPAKHFINLQAALNLSQSDLEAIATVSSAGAVLFRTRRNYSVMKRNQEIAKNLSQDYFEFFWTFQECSPIKHGHSTSSIADLANKIREEFKLNSTTSLTAIIKKLETRGIHVIFADFEYLFDFSDISKKNVPCAFCYEHDGQYSIVINILEKLDDVPWIIFHELAHIFRGDLSESSSLIEEEEIEKFCNQTATETLMPEAWFKARKKDLKDKFSKVQPAVVYHADEIGRELNARSLKSVALRLSELDIISSHVKGYLLGASAKREKNSLRIADYISESYDEDKVVYWKSAFRGFEKLNYTKLQFSVQKALLEERVSIKRASDFYFVSEVEMGALYENWCKELR